MKSQSSENRPTLFEKLWHEFFGAAAERKVPTRVINTIKDQQNASERLVGWIQLCVVLTFSGLYAVSPKTFHPDAPFEPVPWVLSFYFLFTILRLVLSYRLRLPGWFVSLSIVADILLLYGAIFSFHIQYMQPPAFYLKAPTLLYIFIFIALRSLRFEAKYIFISGLAAAAGWMFMVIYALRNDGGAMITRDYVHYMTSNTVLVGAEFDKMVSIIMVAMILGLAMVRARLLLVRAVSETAAAKSLSRFFSEAVAEHITGAESDWEVGQAVGRVSSILNVDIRGFTPLTRRLTPEQQIELVIQYQARMVPIITAHNGEIDKFSGDGIMACFGAVHPSETHAADALRCMEDLMVESDRWNRERAESGLDPVVIHASTASGPIIFGVIGDTTRLEYTVLGDAANLSAKMEKQTKAEKVRAIATNFTLETAIAQGYSAARTRWETRINRPVEGVDSPVDLAVLIEKSA